LGGVLAFLADAGLLLTAAVGKGFVVGVGVGVGWDRLKGFVVGVGVGWDRLAAGIVVGGWTLVIGFLTS